MNRKKCIILVVLLLSLTKISYAQNYCPILITHAFTNVKDEATSTTLYVKDFEAVINYYIQKGYKFVTPKEFANIPIEKIDDNKYMILTIDDGYKSTLLIEKFCLNNNIHFLFSPIMKDVKEQYNKGKNQKLSTEDIRNLIAQGHSLGYHSWVLHQQSWKWLDKKNTQNIEVFSKDLYNYLSFCKNEFGMDWDNAIQDTVLPFGSTNFIKPSNCKRCYTTTPDVISNLKLKKLFEDSTSYIPRVNIDGSISSDENIKIINKFIDDAQK